MFILGFALSLSDSVSDFIFASNSESECAELKWHPDPNNVTQMEVWYQIKGGYWTILLIMIMLEIIMSPKFIGVVPKKGE